jgi:hypothetical protein
MLIGKGDAAWFTQVCALDVAGRDLALKHRAARQTL